MICAHASTAALRPGPFSSLDASGVMVTLTDPVGGGGGGDGGGGEGLGGRGGGGEEMGGLGGEGGAGGGGGGGTGGGGGGGGGEMVHTGMPLDRMTVPLGASTMVAGGGRAE